MAFYVYNTKQQALHADKLAELLSFASNDFCGLISSVREPIIFGVNNSQEKFWSWNTQLSPIIKFMGGGIDIHYDFPQDNKFLFINNSNLCGIDITVPSDASTIGDNSYNLASLVNVHCSSITTQNLYIVVSNPSGNPHNKEYYEFNNNTYVLSSDTSVNSNKVYYYRLENEAFHVVGAEFSSSVISTFDYYGNTIWLSDNRFFIPICYKDNNGNIVSMIFNRDKSGYESFLSARTYYNLLNEFGNKFVFRSGGQTLGDIGQLNITNNKISNKVNGEVKITKPYLKNVPVISHDSMEYKGNGVDHYKGLLLFSDDIQDSDNNVAKEGRIYRISDDYRIPIKHGGTGAVEKHDARINLNIRYGYDTPGNVDYVPYRADGVTRDIGSVYFKIL